MLLGIAGPKNSGKDTFAERFKLYVPCISRAFAEPLKRVCQKLFLLSEKQLYDTEAKEKLDERWGMSPRQMFQQVGTDYVRKQIDTNFWLKHFELWYLQQPQGTNVIVSDLRFQNEVDLIHRLGGKVVYIYRPFVEGEEDTHESEVSATQLEGIDYTIDNCGSLGQFYQAIDFFMEKF
jgi:hypothetical protein